MENRPRTKMPISQRAKQFMPFSAVKGLTEALTRKEKEIVPKANLSEERANELNEKFACLKKGIVVAVTYFDDNEYLQVTGKIISFDDVNRRMCIEDSIISFDDVYDINIGEGCD